MLENKEKKKLSWAVTDGAGRFGVRIFSDKVLEKNPRGGREVTNVTLKYSMGIGSRNVGMKADVAGLKARSTLKPIGRL